MARTIRLADLDEKVQLFLTEALDNGGVVIEDEDGRSRGSVVPWRSPSVEQREAAWESLRKIQITPEELAATGRTEEQLDRILQED